MKRIIAVFLVLSLLVVSVSAAGVYEVENDTEISSVSTYSTYDLSSTESTYLMEIRDYSELIYNIVNWGFDTNLDSIWQRLGYLMSDTSDILSSVGTTNYWLEQLFSSVSSESSLLKVLSAVQSSNYWLELIFDTVATETTLSGISDYLHGSVGQPVLNSRGLLGSISSVESAYITSIVRAGFSGLGNILTVPQDKPFLNQYGEVSEGYSSEGGGFISSILRVGFLGLRSNLYSLFLDPVGYEKLATDGTRKTSDDLSSYDLPSINRSGFMGLASVIYGSESDNVYDGTITSNENEETSFSATGLGPMLNKYVDAIQHDTGLLTYIFASPADLEAKKKSEAAAGSAVDSFFDGSDTSISLDNISSVKDLTNGADALFSTGYSIDDAFAEIGSNDDFLAWFSAESAQSLDSTGAAVAVGDDDPYNMQIYYDQINALEGKRGEID